MIDRASFEPLYIQVKNDIVASIEKGAIKIGDKLMSENEMLQHYGVGRMTIRSALSELVSEGCLKKEQGLGTFCVALPNKVRRMNIDVLVDSGDAYFVPSLLKGISSVLEKNACNLLMHDSRCSAQHILEVLETVLEKGSDGVLIQPIPLEMADSTDFLPVLENYHRAGIPIVTMCGIVPKVKYPSLTIDDYQGSCTATQHLLDCGHRRILGLFSGPNFGSICRLEGFLNTMSQNPDAKAFVINTASSYSDEVLRLISEQHITAIQCYNDLLAVDCMRLLIENGFRIPEDISLIGYDNTALSTAAIPQLTTLSHPKGRLGQAAAKMLLQMIQSPASVPDDVVYKPELIIRKSVATLATK